MNAFNLNIRDYKRNLDGSIDSITLENGQKFESDAGDTDINAWIGYSTLPPMAVNFHNSLDVQKHIPSISLPLGVKNPCKSLVNLDGTVFGLINGSVYKFNNELRKWEIFFESGRLGVLVLNKEINRVYAINDFSGEVYEYTKEWNEFVLITTLNTGLPVVDVVFSKKDPETFLILTSGATFYFVQNLHHSPTVTSLTPSNGNRFTKIVSGFDEICFYAVEATSKASYQIKVENDTPAIFDCTYQNGHISGVVDLICTKDDATNRDTFTALCIKNDKAYLARTDSELKFLMDADFTNIPTFSGKFKNINNEYFLLTTYSVYKTDSLFINFSKIIDGVNGGEFIDIEKISYERDHFTYAYLAIGTTETCIGFANAESYIETARAITNYPMTLVCPN